MSVGAGKEKRTGVAMQNKTRNYTTKCFHMEVNNFPECRMGQHVKGGAVEERVFGQPLTDGLKAATAALNVCTN
jgi:hypothetical protein